MSGMGRQEVAGWRGCIEFISWMGRQLVGGGSMCRGYELDGETTGGGGGQ